MLNSFTKGLSKIFGSKSDKDIKAIMPIVKKINEELSVDESSQIERMFLCEFCDWHCSLSLSLGVRATCT